MNSVVIETRLAKVRARKRAWAKAHPENNRAWRKANPDKAHANSRAWNDSHPEQVRSNVKTWRKNNPEKVKATAKAWWDKQAALKTNHHFAHRLRTRMHLALKRCKRAFKYSELLGCNVGELRTHIEAQFKPGMAWENYGPVWHIDHRRPCARFDLSKPEEQKACFHFTNLQPLWAKENIIKGATLCS
jgi:hypothetical protein